MSVLLIHSGLVWPRLSHALQNSRIMVEVFTARDTRQAWNYFIDPEFLAEEIKAVFIDLRLKGKNDMIVDTISNGLVTEFLKHGFGHGRKPLIACATDEEHNKKLAMAGCSHVTTWSAASLAFIATKLKSARPLALTG